MCPMYEYACYTCNHEFEHQAPVDARDDVDCPRCGCKPTRLYHATRSILKGDCWSRDRYTRGSDYEREL